MRPETSKLRNCVKYRPLLVLSIITFSFLTYSTTPVLVTTAHAVQPPCSKESNELSKAKFELARLAATAKWQDVPRQMAISRVLGDIYSRCQARVRAGKTQTLNPCDAISNRLQLAQADYGIALGSGNMGGVAGAMSSIRSLEGELQTCIKEQKKSQSSSQPQESAPQPQESAPQPQESAPQPQSLCLNDKDGKVIFCGIPDLQCTGVPIAPEVEVVSKNFETKQVVFRLTTAKNSQLPQWVTWSAIVGSIPSPFLNWYSKNWSDWRHERLTSLTGTTELMVDFTEYFSAYPDKDGLTIKVLLNFGNKCGSSNRPQESATVIQMTSPLHDSKKAAAEAQVLVDTVLQKSMATQRARECSIRNKRVSTFALQVNNYNNQVQAFNSKFDSKFDKFFFESERFSKDCEVSISQSEWDLWSFNLELLDSYEQSLAILVEDFNEVSPLYKQIRCTSGSKSRILVGKLVKCPKGWRQSQV